MYIDYLINENTTVHDFLIKNLYSPKIISKLKRNDSIYINGVLSRTDSTISNNDNLRIVLPDEKTNIPATQNKLNIIYEDPYFLIVNKKPDYSIMGTRNHFNNNLSNDVIGYYNSLSIKSTIHLVNRLDLKTEGLVIFAKHQLIHGIISKLNIEKKYYAIVIDKNNELTNGTITKRIKKSNDGIKRIVSSDGKDAITKYQKIFNKNGLSLLDISLLTGRTHQIRVHFSFLGFPLFGDSLYGNESELGLMLESYFIKFYHPIYKKDLTISIPLSPRLKKMFN